MSEAILGFLRELPHVSVKTDKHGNLVATYERWESRGNPPVPRYAFAAHMDHPGWVRVDDKALGPVTRLPGEKHPMQFLGGVPEAYLARPRVRSYGRFAMWNLAEFQVKDGLIHARACDDLVGCAAIVATLMELEESGAEGSCIGLFTRAEEVGFVGALKLAGSGLIPREATIISLETSSEKPPAKIGGGPILRVGDRSSIFDHAATALLAQIAEEGHIAIQRCLMSGGTCEATAYQLCGYRSAALCVALGNYHNCGPGNRIAPEYVSFGDVQGLVRLCTGIAVSRAKRSHAVKALRKRLRTNAEKYKKMLKKRL
ncbi:MAG TPA: M20/M25/M40 family metallo-hydrolase [Chthoniobacteraceae bacterium]|nr:M20/M25/M40 family metallo-hydrolase [Chthoniobacteraceae bacterium]